MYARCRVSFWYGSHPCASLRCPCYAVVAIFRVIVTYDMSPMQELKESDNELFVVKRRVIYTTAAKPRSM